MNTFTPRQLETVWAALQLWRNAYDASRTPPHNIPSCSKHFAEFGPLSIDELDDLLEHGFSDREKLVTVRELADALGTNPANIRGMLHRKGIKPQKRVGQTFRYRLGDLTEVIQHYA